MTRGTDITGFKRQYAERSEGDFPDTLTMHAAKAWDLKYGENPNQHGAIYGVGCMAGQASTLAQLTNLTSVRSDGRGKGGLSGTNTLDIARAMYAIGFFPKPAVVIMKHNIVSGFATRTDEQSQADLFRLARDSDLRSNFGGTVVTNYPLGMETANALFERDGFFADVVAAPSYDDGVLETLEQGSKNMRMGQFDDLDALPRFVGDDTHGILSVKEMPTGRVLVQQPYLTSIRSVDDLVLDPLVKHDGRDYVIGRDPNAQEADDLLTAWWLNIAGARSNGVVFVREGVLVAMGSGQVERVGAVEQALMKGMQKAMDRERIEYDPLAGITGHEQLQDNPFLGAVCSSDAFFPFGDSVGLLGRMGVSAAIQPYGSRRDHESIEAANNHGMAMPATGERCFGHW